MQISLKQPCLDRRHFFFSFRPRSVVHLIAYIFFSLCLSLTPHLEVKAESQVLNLQAPEERDGVLSVDSLGRLKGGVHEFVLENGLKILFYERHVAPVFSGIVSVRVGGVNETLGKTGASHLFEHLAFKGTPEIGTSDYSRERRLLEELEALHEKVDFGQALSSKEESRKAELLKELNELWKIEEFTNLYRKWGSHGMNATTGKELTNYFSSFPTTSFEFWCWMESERLMRPVARQFYKERDVVLEERRGRYENSPSGKLYEHLLGQAFQRHPYRNPVIGYEGDIRRIQPSDVMELHEEYYVASNIVVSIVGDLSVEDALPVVKRYFGRLRTGPRPEGPDAVEPESVGEKRFSVEHDAEPVFFVGYRKPVYPDSKDVAISLFLEYALGSRVSPIFRELVLERKLASSLGYFEAPSVAYPNLAVIYGEPIAPHSNEFIMQAFDQSLQALLKKEIPAHELAVIKRILMKDALVGLASNMGLARQLAELEQQFGSWKVMFDWYEQMFAVTPEEVRQVAQELLVPRGRTIGFLERKGGQL